MHATALWILVPPRSRSGDCALVRSAAGEPAESERAQPDQSEYRTTWPRSSLSARKIGGLPTVFVPGIPEDVVLITNLKNLSVYYQKGSCVALSGKSRNTTAWRHQSSNDDYVIEEYGMIAMIDGVTFA